MFAFEPCEESPSNITPKIGQEANPHVPGQQPLNAKGRAKLRATKKQKERGMNLGEPALNVTRGFHTPSVASCGEDSDVSVASTPHMRPTLSLRTNTRGSPSIRASSLSRALSVLKLQPDSPSVENSSSSSNCDPLEAESTRHASLLSMQSDLCGVSLARDFAAADTASKPIYASAQDDAAFDSPHRKMNALDFEPLKCLGKGAYGTVILVKQKSTGRLFAQKQLKKASITVQKHLIEQTRNERLILESVNRHPFVVKLFYAFQDHQKLYLILEYAQGGELFHHLALERTFTEETSAFYMAEMVLALDHLHRTLGVVYRDLKPENCLLDSEGHLLLTDFGLSKVALDEDGESRCNSILGTIDYMAPEVVQGKTYDAAVDWWSLGALGYDLLTGAPPFASNNHTKTQQKILHGKLTPPYYLSPDAKDLLTRLLRKEPRKRLGGNMPKDLATIKAHRFFRRIDWKALANRDLIAPIQPIITDPAAAENFDVEFTDLAISPIETRLGKDISFGTAADRESRVDGFGSPIDDTFGGFSFVASKSLLECGFDAFE